MQMTIRQITETYGISRRAIQGYEKAGLISSSGTTKYGHLLYDEAMQERIRLIKFYQQTRFTLKEITDIIDMPNAALKPILESRLKNLQEYHEDIRLLIDRLTELIRTLS